MNIKTIRKIFAAAICIGIFAVLLIQFFLLRHIAASGDRLSWYAAIAAIVINFADLTAVMIAAKSYFDVGDIAYSDVTGVRNKIAYKEHIGRLDNAEDTYSVGIAAFDLNNLKSVNDTLGHKAGDEYISVFSDVLAGMQQNGISAYRVGGDEFTVIFEHCNEISVRQFLNSVADKVDKANKYRKIKISYAQGYAVSTHDDYYLIEELTAEADRRMYADKRAMKQMPYQNAERRKY